MEAAGGEDHHHHEQAKEAEAGRKTVVGLDPSEQSLHALQWALQTINFGPSDKLFLVHAKSSPTSVAALGGPGYILTTEMIVSMERSQDREINAFLSKALEFCKEKQVHAEKYVVFGDPRDVICEAVEKVHADILVIGSHGYGAVKRAVLGSVSDHCAHHVKCPVVIVKKSHNKVDRKKH